MYSRSRGLIHKTLDTLNPDRSGSEHSPEMIRDIVSTFPPPNFIGKAVPALVSTRLNRFIWIDDGIEDLAGYKARDFVSHSLTDWLPRLHTPEHSVIVAEIFLKAAQYLQNYLSGRMDIQINIDHIFLRKDGDKKRILSHIWPLQWDKAGNLTLFGLYYVDISQLSNAGPPSVTILSDGRSLQEFHPELTTVTNMHVLNLTEREMELLIMEARGMTIDDISAQTRLSKATIYTHRRNILQRSGHPSTLKLIEDLRDKGVMLG